MHDTPYDPASHRWKIAGLVFLAVYFFYFNWPFFRTPFAPDDMMNMAYHWIVPPWKNVAMQFLIWQGTPRPMGAAFYLPILHFFGLNPYPFHVVLSLLILANVYLVYAFARVLGSSGLVAFLAALVVCYHSGLANLYYDTAFVYDVLCLLFYAAALVYYVRIRGRGRTLRWWETAVFLALFICALNSKEMAVTLPAMLAVYELLYHPSARKLTEGWVRLLLCWRAILLAGVLDILYVYGKGFGPNAATRMPAYRPVFSMARLLDFQRRELVNLFLEWKFTGAAALLVVWVCLALIAFGSRNRILIFCLVFILITPLPIEFLEGRDQACLAIPLAGWALFAAEVLTGLTSSVSRALARVPGYREVGVARMSYVLIALAALFWVQQNLFLHDSYTVTSLNQVGPITERVIQEFGRLNPKVRPHSRVLFMRDPFVDWDMVFIGELWFRDRTVDVKSNHKTPFAPEEIARMDYIFDWVDDKLVRVK